MEGQSESASIHFFYLKFQEEHTVLSNLIDSLSSLNEAERQVAIDRCLAKINRLSDDVKDASSYLPAYDQRKYSEHLKALSDKLSQIRKSLTPKQKFSFKSKSAIKPSPPISFSSPERTNTTATSQTHVSSISAKSNSYIDFTTLKANSKIPEFSSILLSNFTKCLINLLLPHTSLSIPLLSTAAIKSLSHSLLLLHVDGPIHLTNVQNSILILSCRQLRMHDSKNTKVYLFCTSRPIIEDCAGIEFAPFPSTGIWMNKLPKSNNNPLPNQNLWDRVDDFKWLRNNEHSPNWSIIPEETRITKEKFDEFGDNLVHGERYEGGPRLGDVKETLNSFGIRFDTSEEEEEI